MFILCTTVNTVIITAIITFFVLVQSMDVDDEQNRNVETSGRRRRVEEEEEDDDDIQEQGSCPPVSAQSSASVMSVMSNSTHVRPVSQSKRRRNQATSYTPPTTSSAIQLFDEANAAMAVVQVTCMWLFFAKKINDDELNRQLDSVSASSQPCSLVSDTLKCNTLEQVFRMSVFAFGHMEIANPDPLYKDCNVADFRRYLKRDSDIGM